MNTYKNIQFEILPQKFPIFKQIQLKINLKQIQFSFSFKEIFSSCFLRLVCIFTLIIFTPAVGVFKLSQILKFVFRNFFLVEQQRNYFYHNQKMFIFVFWKMVSLIFDNILLTMIIKNRCNILFPFLNIKREMILFCIHTKIRNFENVYEYDKQYYPVLIINQFCKFSKHQYFILIIFILSSGRIISFLKMAK